MISDDKTQALSPFQDQPGDCLLADATVHPLYAHTEASPINQRNRKPRLNCRSEAIRPNYPFAEVFVAIFW